jgi:hypothetical protein
MRPMVSQAQCSRFRWSSRWSNGTVSGELPRSARRQRRRSHSIERVRSNLQMAPPPCAGPIVTARGAALMDRWANLVGRSREYKCSWSQ